MTFPSYAPVALFAYKRLDHVRRCLASLKANRFATDANLFVFCDGPKSIFEKPAVDSVRAYIKHFTGFRTMDIIERTENLGLAGSIITGMKDMLVRHDEVIVVEDDLVMSPHFLAYMNDGLRTYQDEERVASIHGYMFPVGKRLPETFFLPGADCWGWATWNRAWNMFEPDGEVLLRELEGRNLMDAFDLHGAYKFSDMLRRQIAGKNDSWAIRWHASAFVRGMLTLYPGQSLVRNTGHDRTGTHTGTSTIFDVELASDGVRVDPIPVEPNEEALKAVAGFYRRLPQGRIHRTIGALKAGMKRVLR